MASENATVFKTPTASDPVLAEMVKRLVEVYKPEHICLFGSVARAEAGPDSDYDLMVVTPDDAIPERQRNRTGYRAVRHLGAARGILFAKASDFLRQRGSMQPVASSSEGADHPGVALKSRLSSHLASALLAAGRVETRCGANRRRSPA
jgi:hypothetical protein